MPKIIIDKKAPDFTLLDFKGREVQLSNYVGKKNVLLIFNRGFM